MSLRWWIGAATFIAILGGCAPRRRAWHPTVDPHAYAASALAASAYAVVWRGAPLHVAPDRSAPAISLLGPDLSREPWAHAAFTPFRLISEQAGWVELETLGAPATEHCAPGIERLEPFRLRFFVPREALMTVTTREASQRFADGTSITLSRGVPLERVGGEMWRARMGSVSAAVRLGGADIGTRYLPSAPIDRSPRALTLSADAVAAGVPILGQTGRLEGERGEPLPVYATHGRGASELLVELRPSCARIEVRVPAHVVVETGTGPLVERRALDSDGAVPEPPGSYGGTPESIPENTPESTPENTPESNLENTPVVEPGAPVFLRDGRRAGVVAHRTGLAEELAARAERRCFRVALREVPEGTEDEAAWLELCFDRRDVVDPGAGIGTRLDAP